MFKFFTGKKKERDKDEVISAEEAIIEAEAADESDDERETTLSIPDDWDITEEERYVYSFHNSQSPKLKSNQISIYSMELMENLDGSIRITGLIRSTVPNPIQFGETTIVLLDAEEEILARKEFDLSELGHLPPNSARPWNFMFAKSDFEKDIEEMPEDWQLAFQLKPKHRLELEPSWEEALSEKAKEQLERIVEQAKPLGENEINFLGFNAQRRENGDLVINLLIRNGSNKGITIQNIPIGIKDATGEVVAKGSFKLDDLTINAHTSKPWTFIFPTAMLTKDEIDLSSWSAYLIQND